MNVKLTTAGSMRWIACILGSLLIVFFLTFFIGEGILASKRSQDFTALPVKLQITEILMFVFLGVSLFGLILAFFRQLMGGIISTAGTVAFIATDSIVRGTIYPLSDGVYFYVLLFAGLLNIVSGIIRKKALKINLL